ncbi:MAG: hypothetical protein IPO39_16120 [Bacteroidetes bacterium]|nr:hypothetical protein [Bacteroidota bacterium]MBK9544212.1 hypothetical protein [Bacteroidota bacterium]
MKSDLYNDFSYLGNLPFVSYSIEDTVQTLEITHPDNLIIEIEIIDGIFEWFVTIYNSNRIKLVSDWDDHYGKPKDVLKLERQNAVDEFVKNLLNHKLRYKFEKRIFRNVTCVQMFKDDNWIEVICNSKFRLGL